MTAIEIISDSIPALKPGDNAMTAIDWMKEFGVRHLPVVDKGKYAGIISENQILDNENDEDTVEKFLNNYSKISIHPQAHVYEVMKAMAENSLDVLPVVGEQGDLQGTISAFSIMKFFVQLNSLSSPGAILVLEIKNHDYSLAEVARICESNEVKILSSYVVQLPADSILEVTLKLDKSELSELIASFERFQYTIKASYQETEYFEELKGRYNSLMKYLNT